ncbi:MAG TPA: FtsQ-type POTRA domain-containing protein [Terriglobales bacterium]|nr:FtsQ-type POTRA domain-containing protein [Terriglobales bacterium]
MARKDSSAIAEVEIAEAANEPGRRAKGLAESPLDARMLDLEDEAESPFLRGQKRVPVRGGVLPRQAVGRLKLVLQLVAVAIAVALVWAALQRYATQSWRFRLDSSDNIILAGAHNVTRSQVLEVMASDIDRNIFFVPLELRQKQLQQIPWVQSASVLRLLPNRLKIILVERTPVAFVEVNSRIELIDAQGVIMELPVRQAAQYSFPVIVGITDSDPLSTRAARMAIYSRLMKELDSGGAHYSTDISDVDLSDPEDVKATVTDPHGAVLVHLGATDFRQRFQIYVTHVGQWRVQFPTLQSVDLRYAHQVIINPDTASVAAQQNETSPADAGAPASQSEHKQPKIAGEQKKHL